VELLRREPGRVAGIRYRPTPKPEEEAERQRPWRVLLHNDDVTPMEYVTQLLHRQFGLSWARAALVMLKAHVSGLAQVCVLPRDEARERIAVAHARARGDGWPLRFSAEPLD